MISGRSDYNFSPLHLWEKQAPLKGIKDFFRHTRDMVSEETEYHYQQARTYLENTVSGAVSIVEDGLGLSMTVQDKTNYFIDIQDFLTAEELEEIPAPSKPEPTKDNNLIDKILAKGSQDLATTQQAIGNLFNHFRGR